MKKECENDLKIYNDLAVAFNEKTKEIIDMVNDGELTDFKEAKIYEKLEGYKEALREKINHSIKAKKSLEESINKFTFSGHNLDYEKNLLKEITRGLEVDKESLKNADQKLQSHIDNAKNEPMIKIIHLR